MQSHGNLLANAKHMLIANPLLPADRFIHAAPMFHAADAATTFALTFMGGAHICIRGYEPELFGRVVEAERVSVALIVPTMINMPLNHPATAGRDFSAWRLLMYGASPMPVELLLRVCDLLPCDIVQLYGMTEASPLVTSMQRTDNRDGARGTEPAKSRLASCGQAIAGVVSKPGASVTAEEIVAVCREHIAGYKVPRSVVIRSEPLPKSGAGKILKRSLRDPYWTGRERRVN